MAAQSPVRRSDRARADARAGTVLVVDDEADIRELLELSVVRMGLDVESAGSVGEAIELLRTKSFDLCLTDMRLSDGEGIEIVNFVSAHCQDVPVAIITAYGSTENAVSALKAGAFDYLTKPLSLEQLRTLIKSALTLPVKQATKAAAAELLGSSPQIEHVRSMIVKLARSQAPVYIRGESGSGKELAARSIHSSGPRRAAPFIAVNCGAIPENLMESEFFGYRKGAFTGADSDRDGFFQVASGGTLFLDEVAELPLPMQVKLLRAIQEKAVRRVGATAEEAVDVRIICATHQDLQELVGHGKFRQDLYYRLAVIELRMPALRDRREDIRPLGEAILQRLAVSSVGGAISILTPMAWRALEAYDFPGNVRELENILERALALAGSDEVSVEDLQLSPPRLPDEPGDERDSVESGAVSLQDYLDGLERKAILDALEKTRFNRTAAAKRLGITFRALRYRMARLGIQ
jgi:two-component system response regulator PilR (NtrC family)